MSTPSPSLRGVPLKPVLKTDDDRTSHSSGSVKAVQIAEPATPFTLLSDDSPQIRQFSVGLASIRMSGRPPIQPSSSKSSIHSVPSIEGLSGYTSGASLTNTEIPEDQAVHHESMAVTSLQAQTMASVDKHKNRLAEKLLAQVAEWLEHEKAKVKGKKKHRHHHHHPHHGHRPGPLPIPASDAAPPTRATTEQSTPPAAVGSPEPALQSIIGRARTNSIDSESSDVSFDRLQTILDDGVAAMGLTSVPQFAPRTSRRRCSSSSRKSHTSGGRKGLYRAYSSDTDYVDGEVIVPSCDAILDNSKATGHTMGKAGIGVSSLLYTSTQERRGSFLGRDGASPSLSVARKQSREEAERQAWLTFKCDVIRLAHTLRLKGWRRIPLDDLDAADAVGVERLSGALTNAVYVVTPPADLSTLSAPPGLPTNSGSSTNSLHRGSKKTPQRLLLRVYGPQVEHLIDREAELAVLRRLARKKIGPRLLGTFTNGRFEQYLNASPLSSDQLREPDTSVLIARRMRELHDGVEVLEFERLQGPGVWKNWTRWLDMVGKRVSYLDELVKRGKGACGGWKGRHFICGVEWQVFKDAVERYKTTIVDAFYETKGVSVMDKLVFAHNDAQYGNILRIHPGNENSPLLQLGNVHKQLVVIDFEYAAANTPGLEFANHFTEWTYNYHDDTAPHACNHKLYPTPEEQRHFIKAYVEHRPAFTFSGANTPSLTPSAAPDAGTPRGTPGMLPQAGSSSNMAEFMLDARISQGRWKEEERRREDEKEGTMRELMEETKLWRLINSAQWVAWGIVQAKISKLEDDQEQGTPTVMGEQDEDQRKEQDSCRSVDEPEVVEPGQTKWKFGQHDDNVPEEAPWPLHVEQPAAEEFDYLGYAHERAMFVLGDCIEMGILTWDNLDESVRQKVKIVTY